VRTPANTGADPSPFASVFCLEMILVGMWFGDHGSALRFYGA
jgi:hypothetical protein